MMIPATTPPPRSRPAERSIHLVDVENLVGAPNPRPDEVRTVGSLFDEVAGIAAGDQTVIASSHYCAKEVWFGWDPAARRLVQSGPDGADLALLAVVAHERLAERFTRVVIGSGDGIFAEAASRLQQAGLSVTVVSRPEGLSRRLQFAVRDIRFISPPPAASERIATRAA